PADPSGARGGPGGVRAAAARRRRGRRGGQWQGGGRGGGARGGRSRGVTPIVTGLRERKRGRVAVELDGRPWRVLAADAVVRTGLAVGRPLDRPTARELAREIRRARALAQATRTLATSGRSRQELERRLARAGHGEAGRERHAGTPATPRGTRLLTRHARRARGLVCAGGMKRGTISRHSI